MQSWLRFSIPLKLCLFFYFAVLPFFFLPFYCLKRNLTRYRRCFRPCFFSSFFPSTRFWFFPVRTSLRCVFCAGVPSINNSYVKVYRALFFVPFCSMMWYCRAHAHTHVSLLLIRKMSLWVHHFFFLVVAKQMTLKAKRRRS